ncbi:MAG: hypothetical protein U0228_20645 [Myxococcaceae bacterium]
MTSPWVRWSALAVALASLAASATVVVYETIDDMARRVPVIVRGKVARSVSGWDDAHRRIWTWTEVVVSDSIKGKASGIVLVKQPGGEVEGIGQAVSGAARFSPGEECVLFLEPAPDEAGAFRPSGLAAGKVSIVTELGQTSAVRNTDGLAFAAPAGKRAEPVAARELLGSPADFISRIRKATATTGGAR